MKDVTAILKMPGTIDLKDNRNYLIKKVYKSESQIKEKDVLALLNKKRLVYDVERKNKLIKKEKKKNRNVEALDIIDSLELINELNEYFEDYPINIDSHKIIKNLNID